MSEPVADLTNVRRAAVYKNGELAASLTRTDAGIEFSYTREWVTRGGPPVATTLPVRAEPVVTAGGAVPAFFAGLLPEGRRLSALRRSVKTSADDELSLLLAVGSDAVGDTQVLPEGSVPLRATPRLQVSSFEHVRFHDLLAEHDIVIDHVAIPGVQDKASLAMVNVPMQVAGASYVLKLNPPEYPHLIENEAFFLERAPRALVDAARARVVHDRDGTPGLVVTRFDRAQVDGELRAFAMEDGCQVLNLHPEAKYRKSTEEVLGALVRVCTARAPAALTFLRQAVFAYVTANGDAHAKNFSVLADASGQWRPSPAYDLPTSHPYGDHTLALPVAGKRDGNVTGRRYIALGVHLGLNERAAKRAVRETAAGVDGWVDELDELPFDAGVIRKLQRVIRRRQRLLLDDC